MTSQPEVTLENLTLGKLFKNRNGILCIPDYQRPYEWKTDHVNDLLNDINEALLRDREYLLGTIILHENNKNNNLEIVDGQQRLITLTILLSIIGSYQENDLPLLNAKLPHLKSQYYIKNTAEIIKNHQIIKNSENLSNYLKDKIKFTVLKVIGEKSSSLDLAYTFFDSANSKGKALSDFDLLKAHHLMFIPEEQETLARKHNDEWQSKDSEHQNLFSNTLRRIRMWNRGQDRDSKADRCDYYEFVSAIEPDDIQEAETHVFNRYMQPSVFDSWRRVGDQIVLHMQYPQPDAEMALPMEIPQTIEGGDAFFLYAKHYHTLYEKLFSTKNNDGESTATAFARKLSESILNNYLRNAYNATVLLYYDKFRELKLIEAAVCLEMIISNCRYTKDRVRIESILTHVKNTELVQVVLSSTNANHVIGQLHGKMVNLSRGSNEGTTVRSYYNSIKKFYDSNKGKIKNRKILEIIANFYKIN